MYFIEIQAYKTFERKYWKKEGYTR